jgi:hypothetical protein
VANPLLWEEWLRSAKESKRCKTSCRIALLCMQSIQKARCWKEFQSLTKMSDYEAFKTQVVDAMNTLRSLSSSCQQASQSGKHSEAVLYHSRWLTASNEYDSLVEKSKDFQGEGQQDELNKIAGDLDTIADRYGTAYSASSFAQDPFRAENRGVWKA